MKIALFLTFNFFEGTLFLKQAILTTVLTNYNVNASPVFKVDCTPLLNAKEMKSLTYFSLRL